MIYHTQECRPNYERGTDYEMEKSSRLYKADSIKYFLKEVITMHGPKKKPKNQN